MNALGNSLGMCDSGQGPGSATIVVFVIISNIHPVYSGTTNSLIDHADMFKQGVRGRITESRVTKVLDSIINNYDKRIRPNYGGPPVEVEIAIFVHSISALSEVDMDLKLSFYFRQYWVDPRLKFSATSGIKTLSVNSDFLKLIWVPDTIFPNEKNSDSLTIQTNHQFIRINHTGSILRSMRLSITTFCFVELRYFPMDRQLCSIQLQSFRYTTNDIIYKWHEGNKSVSISKDVSLPQFSIKGIRLQSTEILIFKEKHSRLTVEIKFFRSLGYYVIQIYIPSALNVVISWVSFCLNRLATPARIVLGVNTVLIMTTLIASINDSLPKITYVKSIDVFLGFCFMMVFFGILEYTALSYIDKRIQLQKRRYLRALRTMRARTFESTGQTDEVSNRVQRDVVRISMEMDLEQQDYDEASIVFPKHVLSFRGVTSSNIDKYSRVVFPVTFFCFNLSYWLIFLNISDVYGNDIIPIVRE